MSKGTRCPFRLYVPTEEDYVEKENIISVKQPIDPADPDGIKLTHRSKVCDSTHIEDIMKHELQFTQLQGKMTLNNILKRKAVYEATLSPSLLTS